MQERQSAFTVERTTLLTLVFATVIVFAVLFVVLSSQRYNATLVHLTPTRPAATHGRAEDDDSWARLSDAHRATLRPLRQVWTGLDPPAKQRWLRVAAHVQGLEADATVRVHARMTEWARLSPQQRGAARLRYVQARHAPPVERVQHWNVYRHLPKRVLPSDPVESRLTVVAPVVVRVGPGASTMLVTQLPASRTLTSTGPD